MGASGWTDEYSAIAEAAASLGLGLDAAAMAALAEERGFGEAELRAVRATLEALGERRREESVRTLLRLSRLPRSAPKTFENFDFTRLRGRDADALRALPSLASLHARRNIAFIGPGGVGKTHLAQAYGRACCVQGYRTYYLKANELRDKLCRAAAAGSASRAMAGLVKPSCLIIDEVGRCRFDRACTDLFFDLVDRRYEKEGPNTLILTSNAPVSDWGQFFDGDDALLCALDRIFDRASVFLMRGPSFRGAECDTYSVDAAPTVSRASR